MKPGNIKISYILQISNVLIILILIFSTSSLFFNNSSLMDVASAGSSWTQTSQADFDAGTVSSVSVSSEGNITLEHQTDHFKDEFFNDARIGFKNNLTIDTKKGEVRILEKDRYGTEIWNRTIGGSDSDIGYSVQQTSDGGYIIVGNTWSFGAGGEDVWLKSFEAARPIPEEAPVTIMILSLTFVKSPYNNLSQRFISFQII